MKLSRNSHRTIEFFFRDFLKDENFKLPLTHFYIGNFSRIITLFLRINGITIGRHIFVLPELVSRNRNNQKKLPEDLVVHEIMHVIQYKKTGFVKFLYLYLRDYWKNLRITKRWDAAARRQAYLDIPYETEAREAAHKFLEWNQKFQSETK